MRLAVSERWLLNTVTILDRFHCITYKYKGGMNMCIQSTCVVQVLLMYGDVFHTVMICSLPLLPALYLQARGCFMCSFLTAVNPFLSSPNDGVVELKRSMLPFGNHVSNTRGECHVRIFFCPSQTRNRQRNAEMDNAAAR